VGTLLLVGTALGTVVSVRRGVDALNASLVALAGDLASPVPRPGIAELADLADHIAGMARALARAQTDKERLGAELAQRDRRPPPRRGRGGARRPPGGNPPPPPRPAPRAPGRAPPPPPPPPRGRAAQRPGRDPPPRPPGRRPPGGRRPEDLRADVHLARRAGR